MIIKNILNFEKKIQLECPLSIKDFENAFKEKYVSKKKSKFKGEFERSYFKMRLDKDFWRMTDFSELTGKVEKSDTNLVLKGKVELSDTMTTMILLGMIVLSVIIISQFFSTGFDREILGAAFLFVIGFVAITHFRLYREKQNYIDEFKSLFKENLKTNRKHKG
jgi:hypothetical protein